MRHPTVTAGSHEACMAQFPVLSLRKSTGQGMVSMADEQESVALVAIARAASNHPPHEWFELPSSHRTRAIYRELQQLDAAASGRLQEAIDQSAPERTRRSGSAA
jgi:hypothetical protein